MRPANGEHWSPTMPDTPEQRFEATMRLGDYVALHAGPSCAVALLASRFSSDIRLSCEGREANAKSMMQLMLLCVTKENDFGIRCDGPDAK